MTPERIAELRSRPFPIQGQRPIGSRARLRPVIHLPAFAVAFLEQDIMEGETAIATHDAIATVCALEKLRGNHE